MSESSRYIASSTRQVPFKVLLLAAAIAWPVAPSSTNLFQIQTSSALAKGPPDGAGRPEGAGRPDNPGNSGNGANDNEESDDFALGRTVIFPVYTDSTESYLRFANFGGRAGTTTVVVHDIETGERIGEWTSPSIPAKGAIEVAVGDIADAAGVPDDDDAAVVRITATFKGHVQHLGWANASNSLSNLTSCQRLAAPKGALGFVSGPGREAATGIVQIVNAGPTARAATLTIFNAATGETLAEWTSEEIAGFAALTLSTETLADEAGIADDIDALSIRLENPAPHLALSYLEGVGTGSVSDLTAGCPLKGGAPEEEDEDGEDADDDGGDEDDDDSEDGDGDTTP